MDPKDQKERLEQEEQDRKKSIDAARKELEINPPKPEEIDETDEQDSDGSANAFDNK